MKDPMKLSDIEGAAPAQIPGYTGAKAYQIIARTKGILNLSIFFLIKRIVN